MSDKPAILVTGGAGYIGSHACKALANAGYVPVTYDNLSRGHDWAVKWGPLERGDILDRARLDEVLGKYDFAGAMHFAAFIEVGESVKDPARFYHTNVGGAANVIEALGAKGIKAFVFSSTAAVYGIPAESAGLTEDVPPAPINPYGETKLAVEQLLKSAAPAYGLESVALRYFNAAGADADGQTGEEHEPETHLIPLALRAVAQGGRLKLFGTDYPTPDGSAVRDYIHVADLADAHVRALRYLMDGGTTTAMNLGTGSGYSVRQVIEAVGAVTETDLAFDEVDRRPGDPAFLIADPTRAKKLLGFETRRSEDLQFIVKSAWDWMTKYRDGAMKG